MRNASKQKQMSVFDSGMSHNIVLTHFLTYCFNITHSLKSICYMSICTRKMPRKTTKYPTLSSFSHKLFIYTENHIGSCCQYPVVLNTFCYRGAGQQPFTTQDVLLFVICCCCLCPVALLLLFGSRALAPHCHHHINTTSPPPPLTFCDLLLPCSSCCTAPSLCINGVG